MHPAGRVDDSSGGAWKLARPIRPVVRQPSGVMRKPAPSGATWPKPQDVAAPDDRAFRGGPGQDGTPRFDRGREVEVVNGAEGGIGGLLAVAVERVAEQPSAGRSRRP